MKLSIYILVVGLILAAVGYGQNCNTPEAQIKRQFLQQLPSQVQARVWRNHIRYGKRVEGLNDVQSGIADELLALIKDDTYTAEGVLAARPDVLSLDQRIKDNFSKAQIGRMFLKLTEEEQRGYSLIPAKYRQLATESVLDCNCNIEIHQTCDYCFYGGPLGTIRCFRQDWGCGYAWVMVCDGTCWNEGDPPLITVLKKKKPISPLG